MCVASLRSKVLTITDFETLSSDPGCTEAMILKPLHFLETIVLAMQTR